MGIFDKIFGKKNNISDELVLARSSEMLDENFYWELIRNSIIEHDNQVDQEKFLINELEKLTLIEIIGFRLRTDQLLFDTYNSEMWCAGYIMNGGCSDDSFEYFRNWIISRGKETYYKAKENPDNLISEVRDEMDYYDFEDFWYVANEAFIRKTNKDLYDYIDEENFKTNEGNYPKIEFNWEEDEPESMRKICPKLYDKLWED